MCNNKHNDSKSKIHQTDQEYPPKKRNPLAAVSFFLAAFSLLFLCFAGINLFLGFHRGTTAAADFRLLITGITVITASTLAASIGALIALFLRARKRGFAISGLVLSLLTLLISSTMLIGYHYLTGTLEQDNAFRALSESDLNVVETDTNGKLIHNTGESTETQTPEEIEDQTGLQYSEIKRSFISKEDLPEKALSKFYSGEPARPSYLHGDTSQITNFLLFGLDESNSSDSIILVSLDRIHKKIKMLSIARDSFVFLPEWGNFVKLTYAYHWGGANMSIRTINYNFSLNLTNYVAVDFDQMEQIIDYIGGVDVTLDADEVRMLRSYDNIHVGDCHLSGAAAVEYSRIRQSNLSDSDKKRTSRQREVLLSMLSSAKQLKPTQYPTAIRNMLRMCSTSFDPADLMSLCAEVLGKNYEVEQYFFPEDQVDWWGGIIQDHFYYVYDLRRASDRMYRIIYEDLYISGYDD